MDVVGLKDKLDLKEARLNAIVVEAVEAGLAPHLGTDLRSIGVELGFNPGIDENYSLVPQTLSETAKDALVKVLRRCDPVLNEILKIRRLPNRIAILNRMIYFMAVLLSLFAAIIAVITFWLTDTRVAVGSLIVLSFTLLSTAAVAVVRQIQVHNAEQAIIHEDAQP